MNVQFKQWKCSLIFGQYENNKPAIRLIDAVTHEPVATATVFINGVKLDKDEVIIKDYSENEGMLQCLIDAGIISEPRRWVKTGFVTCPICRLEIATYANMID